MVSQNKSFKKNILDAVKTLQLDSDISFEMKYWEDGDGNIFYVTPACEMITGYSVNEFISTPKLLDSIIHSEDLEKWNKYNLPQEKGKIKEAEFRIHNKNGRVIWIEHFSQPLFDDNNKAIACRGSIRDITDKKLTSDIYITSPTVLFMWDNSEGWPVSFVSENIEKLAGYSQEDFISKKISYKDIIHPDDLAEVLVGVEENIRLEREDSKLMFYKIVAKDGSIKWVKDATKLKRNSAGHVTHFIGSVTDITQQKKAELTLAKSRKKYHDLFKKSTDATLIIQDDRFIDCNKAALKMLGFSNLSELLQKHPSELSPKYQPDGSPSDQKAEEMIQIALKRGSHRFDWVHQKADRTNFPVEVLLTPITNEDGSILIHTVWRDITERKKNEQLQKALFSISEQSVKNTSIEEFYETLHEIINDLMPAKNIFIAIHNSETDVVKFPYYFDIYDPSPIERKYSNGLTEYILEKKSSEIIKGKKNIKAKGIIKVGKHYPREWVGLYLEFEGKYRGVLALQDYDDENAYTEEDRKILQFVAEQIVKVIDKKFADERLLNSLKELSLTKKDLELLNKNKNRFFSIIAHDLRSPFMALMGITQMITESREELNDEEMKMMTDTIHNSTKNLYKLIENLLTWSQLQMDSYKIVPKYIDLREITIEVSASLMLAAKGKGIAVINNVQNIRCFADENAVKTILRNLVNNAIKYTNRDEGKILISSIVNDGFVRVTVEDNGIGMGKSVLKNIFSIVTKVSKLGTEKEVGTGLGLILCKELVKNNNGKIWVESEEGKGSKFIFTLPLN